MRVEYLSMLQGMEKQGFIKLHEHTGVRIGDGIMWYIDDYKDKSFTFKGRKFVCRFSDGCFYPSVYYSN